MLQEIASDISLGYGLAGFERKDFIPGIDFVKIYVRDEDKFVEIHSKNTEIKYWDNKISINFPTRVEDIKEVEINDFISKIYNAVKSHTKLIVEEKRANRIEALVKRKMEIEEELKNLE